jgi:hypothetical protein
MGSLYIPRYKSVILRVEGNMVQVIQNGMLLMDLPWEQAKVLSRAIRAQAGRAEQNEKILKVVSDQAVLIRQGFPVALTNRPDVFKEAGNEAAHDRELRRSMPGSIPSGVVFGNPAVMAMRAARRTIGAKGIPSGEFVAGLGGNGRK